MNIPGLNASSWKTRNTRSAIYFNVLAFVWTATMVLIDKAVLWGWPLSPGQALVAIALNAALGLGVILSFIRHLRGMDELQRKIQFDAFALTVGIGFVGSFTYSLLVTTGFIVDAEISDILVLMAFTYIGSVVVGQVRYR